MIECRVDNGIAVLEINRPPVNSYTTELLKELDAAILDARFDDNVHAIVITGKVEKFFRRRRHQHARRSSRSASRIIFALHGHEVLMRLENTPKIVIAAINGHAVGGGLEIAMACDIRIAKKKAAEVGLAEINLGVMPGMGGTAALAAPGRQSPRLELCATGKTIAFEEAPRNRFGSLHLRKGKLHARSNGLRAPVYCAEQEQPRRRQSQSAPSQPASNCHYRTD